MSEFPELRAALADAAVRHYGDGARRLRFPRRAAVAAAAAAAAAALIFVVGDGSRSEDGVAGVPEATLERSRALTRAPAVKLSVRTTPPPQPMAEGDLPRVAAEIKARPPYPPGRVDSFPARRPSDPAGMGAIEFRADLQALLEYRAGCMWADYWLSEPAERSAATAILVDVERWPTVRGRRTSWAEVAGAARRGERAGVERFVLLNCRMM
jgi:hypothetical protein